MKHLHSLVFRNLVKQWLLGQVDKGLDYLDKNENFAVYAYQRKDPVDLKLLHSL